MHRLIEENINSPEEYAKIYQQRAEKGVNWADERRWKTLLSKFEGGSLIDIGCLDSLIGPMAKEQYPDAHVVGLDFSLRVIEQNIRKYPNIRWMFGDAYSTPFTSNSFDYVVLGEVIEHLERPADAIAEAVRILKPGGILALSTPLNEAVEPGAVDAHRHLWSFSEEDIVVMLSPLGKLEVQVLRSQHEPEYKYCFPQLLAWLEKN